MALGVVWLIGVSHDGEDSVTLGLLPPCQGEISFSELVEIVDASAYHQWVTIEHG